MPLDYEHLRLPSAVVKRPSSQEMFPFKDHNCDGQREHTGVQSPFREREEDQSLWLALDFTLPEEEEEEEEEEEAQSSSMEAVTRS